MVFLIPDDAYSRYAKTVAHISERALNGGLTFFLSWQEPYINFRWSSRKMVLHHRKVFSAVHYFSTKELFFGVTTFLNLSLGQ